MKASKFLAIYEIKPPGILGLQLDYNAWTWKWKAVIVRPSESFLRLIYICLILLSLVIRAQAVAVAWSGAHYGVVDKQPSSRFVNTMNRWELRDATTLSRPLRFHCRILPLHFHSLVVISSHPPPPVWTIQLSTSLTRPTSPAVPNIPRR